jgi:hypothetical protein
VTTTEIVGYPTSEGADEPSSLQPQTLIFEKLNPALLKGLLDGVPHHPQRLPPLILKIPNGAQSDAHSAGEFVLRPIQQGAGSTTLSGGNFHSRTINYPS